MFVMVPGRLPADWSRLASMQILELYENSLTGASPQVLQGLALTSARAGLAFALLVSCDTNAGPLPAIWSNMSSLQDLALQVNFLTGV